MKKFFKQICVFVLMACMMCSVGNITQISAASKLKTPTNLSAKLSTSTKAKISWKKIEGAKKYQLYFSINGGSYKILKTTTKTNYTHTNLKAGRIYKYKVRAVSGSTKSAWSTIKNIKTIANDKINLTTKISGTKVTIKWKSVKNATGYLIYRRTSSGSYKKIGSTKNLLYKDNSVKQLNKKYVYKVVAYRKSGTKIFNGSFGTKSITTAKSDYLMNIVKPYSSTYYFTEYTNGKKFESGGASYSNGFSLSDYNGNAIFNVQGAYRTLTFTAGHIDNTEKVDTYVRVYCDDILTYEILMTSEQLPKKITVDIRDVEKLEISTLQNTGGNWFNSGAVWGFGDIVISK